MQSPAVVEALRDEAWSILYNTTIQETISLALWPVKFQAGELKLKMRKQAGMTQQGWFGYADGLTKAEQQGRLSTPRCAKEVVTALGLYQSADSPDVFDPLAQPRGPPPGVPFWLLLGTGSGKLNQKKPDPEQKVIELHSSERYHSSSTEEGEYFRPARQAEIEMWENYVFP